MGIPLLGFAAFSGTGKTTLIEKLIPALADRGIKVAVIKHDAHGLTFDHEGKDSARFAAAGAEYSIVSSHTNAAVFVQHELEIEEAASYVKNVDLILVEGYKGAAFSQIGLARKATGKGFTAEFSRFLAIASDEKPDCETLWFSIDDVSGIGDFIKENLGRFTQF